MRHSLAPLLIGLAIFGSAFVSSAAEVPFPKDLEPRFRAELRNCERFDGSTGEPACEGASVEVFIAGDDARLLRWWHGSSRFSRTRDYYLANGKLVFVVERVVRKYTYKLDAEGDPEERNDPKQVLFHRIRPGNPSRMAAATYTGHKEESWAEMEEHVTELLAYFQAHRSDFERVSAR